MRRLLLLAMSLVTCAAFASDPDPVCTKASATLRRGPGAQFPITWKPGRYMPFLKLESKNGWVKLQDVDGEIHWGQPRDFSSSLHCAVVKSQVATLRKEPIANGVLADLHSLDRYTPLKKLESQGEWVHVEYEGGGQGWLHESTIWKPTRVASVKFEN